MNKTEALATLSREMTFRIGCCERDPKYTAEKVAAFKAEADVIRKQAEALPEAAFAAIKADADSIVTRAICVAIKAAREGGAA